MTELSDPAGNRIKSWVSLLPALVLGALVVWGLMLRPLVFGLPSIPLEIVFLASASFAIGLLLWIGFTWLQIQQAIVQRLAKALPAIFILLLIGPLVAAWMTSGTIPMLVSWGVRLIDPQYLYVVSFAVAAIFSILTGTSWGSAATVGVVLIGIGSSVGADIAIVAGAVIGGAYFGDKLSPLSDTTNMAAIASGVDLFDHIQSMLWSTVPSAIFALVAYSLVGLFFEIDTQAVESVNVSAFLSGLDSAFVDSLALLIPVLIVLVGSIRKWPTIPVLLLSIMSAILLALVLQDLALSTVSQALVTGVTLTPIDGIPVVESVRALVERGGLYSMQEAIFVAVLVFFFVGAIDLLDTMPRLVQVLFGFVRGPKQTVLAALSAAATTNALTSNQSATAFIVGDAFSRRFDDLLIPRRVLSRSIEDTGTMIESIIPWHATALFMVATLGVSVSEYWYWQFLTLANLLVAPLLAITGIGCGFNSSQQETDRERLKNT